MLITVFLCFTVFPLIAIYRLGFRVNASGSLPGRVYQITPLASGEKITPGEYVVIDLGRISGNPVIREGTKRGYVSKTPLLKQIGAVPGDTVELYDGLLSVNGITSSMVIASQDSFG